MNNTNIDKELHNYVLGQLKVRDVDLTTMAENVYNIQVKFNSELTIKECREAIDKILMRRDILQLMAVSFQMDNMANLSQLDEPLQEIVANDRGEFGVDESIALAMCSEYGSIALTTFGRIDSKKVGDAKRLDDEQKSGGKIATFTDDICLALIACGAAKVVHDKENQRQAATITD